MSEPVVKLPQQVFIVSDGTGNTAEKVVRAAFRQFQGHVIHLRTFTNVTRTDQLSSLFRRAERHGALVVTTLVRHEMRETAERIAIESRVRHIDLIGRLIGEFESFLDQKAVGVPGLLHRADDSYFRRVEAVEFTVKADDGKEPRMLHEADIVLTGVSRTSKTPLSTFLAHKGYKVSNVPIVLDRPLPQALFDIDQGRVFALTIDPSTLHDIRLSRLEAMGMSRHTNYGDMDYILAELEYAHELFRGNPDWPLVDVTSRAVEETAATILQIFHDRGYEVHLVDHSQL